MSYKVVATPFGGRSDTSHPHEHEGLKPLGITIETADVSSQEAYLNSIRDADAVIAGGRWLNGDVINQLEKCKVIANGGVGVIPFAVNLNGEKHTYEGWIKTSVLTQFMVPYSSTFNHAGVWWAEVPNGFWTPDTSGGDGH